MAAHHIPTLFTQEQYLEMERKAEYKSEYYKGEIFAMAGVSPTHALLIRNLSGRLFMALMGTRCGAFTNDLRVRTRPGGLHSYPGIVAVCGKAQYAPDRSDTLLNPVLIIEVLSRSTERNDRGFKFTEYRQIESLQQYVLVSQYSMHVEVYTKTAEDTWILREYKAPEQQAEFSSVGCFLNVGDVYQGLTLQPEAELSDSD